MANLVNSVMKVLTIVVVVLIVLVIVPAVAPFVTARMAEFGAAVGNLLTAIWQAFSHMIHNLDWDVDLQGIMTGSQSQPGLDHVSPPYPGDPTG